MKNYGVATGYFLILIGWFITEWEQHDKALGLALSGILLILILLSRVLDLLERK